MRKSFYALLLVLLVLAACGQSPQTGTNPTTPPAATTVAEATTVPEATAAEATTAPEPTAAEATAAPEPTAPAAQNTDDSNCGSDEVFCVGLVTDVGRIDDKSFNQSAWTGVQDAQQELNFVANYIETTNPNDYAANIGLFAEKEYDLIVSVGFGLGQATTEAAQEYTDIQFIGIDQFQVEELPNLVGLIFNEDRAGYLAGVLAAELSKTNTIAAVLGTDLVPPVVAFKEGFENGAKSVKPDITVISTYHPGGLENAFSDPEWGATTARQAIDQQADVIFGAGGATGNGALIETAGNEGVYCIGVDTDQWETVQEAHPCLISSAMKLITPGVAALIKLANEGQFPTGNYFGQVGLAPFHDFESQVSSELQTKLDETAAGLEDGSITTGYAPGG